MVKALYQCVQQRGHVHGAPGDPLAKDQTAVGLFPGGLRLGVGAVLNRLRYRPGRFVQRQRYGILRPAQQGGQIVPAAQKKAAVLVGDGLLCRACLIKAEFSAGNGVLRAAAEKGGGQLRQAAGKLPGQSGGSLRLCHTAHIHTGDGGVGQKGAGSIHISAKPHISGDQHRRQYENDDEDGLCAPGFPVAFDDALSPLMIHCYHSKASLSGCKNTVPVPVRRKQRKKHGNAMRPGALQRAVGSPHGSNRAGRPDAAMYSNSGANKPRRGLFNRHYYRAFCPEMQLQNGYMESPLHRRAFAV